MSRLVLIFIVAAALGLTVGCTLTEFEADPAPADVIDDADLGGDFIDAEAFAAFGAEVDEVIPIAPGGARTPRAVQRIDPTLDVASSRHVARVLTAEGPVDLYDLVVRMEGELMRCNALVVTNGSSMGCGPVDEDPSTGRFDQPMVVGTTGFDERLVLELMGPTDTTHFILILDGHRIGVAAIEGRAAISIGDRCGVVGGRLEAWNGDELLRADDGIGADFC